MANKNRTGNALVTVSFMSIAGDPDGFQEDRNHKHNVILNAWAGKIPSTRVISGTIAEKMGLIPGKVYLISYQEKDEAEYVDRTGVLVKGPQFDWVVAGPCQNLLEAAELRKVMELGAGFTFDVEAPVAVVKEGSNAKHENVGA